MIVIVDFSILYYRMMFGSKRAVIENSDYFAHLLMNGVFQNFKDFNIDKKNRLILAVDCKKGSNWRVKYYTENSKDFPEYTTPVRHVYKGGRPKDQEIPWDKVYEILEDFLNVMVKYSDVQVVQHPRAEADDVIAVTTQRYQKTEEIVIVSSDSDFKQLLSKNVSLYDPIRKIMYKVKD